MFFHFDIPIYKPGWDWRSWRDMPTPEMYNPAKLDTDQWMGAAQALGARYAVLVAKHCSGFLQWQSDLYPYGVKQSPWRSNKGDVVRDFVESCRKYGIQPGLYASVSANGYLEVDNPGLINRGKGGDPLVTAHLWEIHVSTAGDVSDSREIGLRAEPYKTPDGAHGVTLHIPLEGLLILDPSGRAYAFNIFNRRLAADNWPTGMDESDLGKYRLALGRFNPRKMGYLRMTPAE